MCALVPPAADAFATIVFIEYEDRNAVGGFPDNGGPHWKGFVDTVADTLTITSWVDLAGTPEFWTPLWSPSLADSPLVWHAVGAHGEPFDVPDDFLGEITPSFAFISPVSARNMAWNEGQWGVKSVFSLPEEADFYPGWGGVRKPVSVDGQLELVYDLSADETSMPLLPIDSLGLAESSGATVTAYWAASAEPNDPQAVPETSSFLFGAAGAACCMIMAGWRWLRPRLSPVDGGA